jgi:hypothetical protein
VSLFFFFGLTLRLGLVVVPGVVVLGVVVVPGVVVLGVVVLGVDGVVVVVSGVVVEFVGVAKTGPAIALMLRTVANANIATFSSHLLITLLLYHT